MLLLLTCVLAMAAGVAGAMRPPRVISYTIDAAWPATAPPLRIVQLSDTHANDPFMSAARLRSIVARVNAAAPDIVVLTGDYIGDKTIGGSPLDPDTAVGPFRALKSRFGVYAVLGNHDHNVGARNVAAALRRAGVRVLTNEHVRAGPLTIAGVDDDFGGQSDLAAAADNLPRGAPAILLSHSPDIFPRVDGRFLATLSGHTHGGQITLPMIGPLVTASRYGRRYVHGHVVERNRHLIVSAGLGTSLLPMRIGVPPEITVVTIR